VDNLASWEAGELGEAETIILFRDMVNSGLVWRLGDECAYEAKRLIEAGLVTFPSKPYHEAY
jgi:hypothetical protein